jgi:hypothetical protein
MGVTGKREHGECGERSTEQTGTADVGEHLCSQTISLLCPAFELERVSPIECTVQKRRTKPEVVVGARLERI